jgi:hypothetical protein
MNILNWTSLECGMGDEIPFDNVAPVLRHTSDMSGDGGIPNTFVSRLKLDDRFLRRRLPDLVFKRVVCANTIGAQQCCTFKYETLCSNLAVGRRNRGSVLKATFLAANCWGLICQAVRRVGELPSRRANQPNKWARSSSRRVCHAKDFLAPISGDLGTMILDLQRRAKI